MISMFPHHSSDQPEPAWDSEITKLNRDFGFKDNQSVHAYLMRHPKLINLIWESYEKIYEIFPENSPLVLEIFKDCEVECEAELFLNIQTNLKVEDALAKLDQLDNDDFLDFQPKDGGSLTIDVEFI